MKKSILIIPIWAKYIQPESKDKSNKIIEYRYNPNII